MGQCRHTRLRLSDWQRHAGSLFSCSRTRTHGLVQEAVTSVSDRESAGRCTRTRRDAIGDGPGVARRGNFREQQLFALSSLQQALVDGGVLDIAVVSVFVRPSVRYVEVAICASVTPDVDHLARGAGHAAALDRPWIAA